MDGSMHELCDVLSSGAKSSAVTSHCISTVPQRPQFTTGGGKDWDAHLYFSPVFSWETIPLDSWTTPMWKNEYVFSLTCWTSQIMLAYADICWHMLTSNSEAVGHKGLILQDMDGCWWLKNVFIISRVICVSRHSPPVVQHFLANYWLD